MKARESIKEAERFAYGFRELKMLNIDKSVKDMGRLKDMIRATSFEKGFDPTNATKAFFDVQSITGKFGLEVDSIVSKQGEFAQLMQADFNSWISGTAKAMANFGFGSDKLDEFNRAAFATVKTGVTTFNELAKVQSVYAGAAASAKQNFASANKMFSVFTVKSGSVAEAATLTKSLFNDLTKQSTIDAFNKIGIDVYDVNKQFKQADGLLLELQKKFRTIGDSDQKVMQLKNQFTGSEGLISFVQAATDQTNQLRKTFDSFDSAKFSLPKALEIAKNDQNHINLKLENQTKVLLTQIGENLIPIKNALAKIAAGLTGGIMRLFQPQGKEVQNYKNLGAKYIFNEFPGLQNPGALPEKEFDKLMADLNARMNIYQDRLSDPSLGMLKKRFRDESFGSVKNIFLKERGFFDWFDNMFGAGAKKFQAYQFDAGAFEALKQFSKEARIARANAGAISGGVVPDVDPDPGASTKTDMAGVQSIARGSQTKAVTINIDSFIKSFTPTHQSINSMNRDEMERWMTEMFMRVINSAETTAG